MKLALRATLVLGLTAVLLAAWLRAVDGAALWGALRASSPGLVVLAGLVNLLHVPARALRWRVLLDAGGEVPPFRELVLTTAVGYLVTFVIPGRLGEVVRPALLAHRTSVPLGAALASVFFERLLDVVLLVALLVIFVLASPELASTELQRVTWFLAALTGGGLAAGLAVHRLWRSKLDRLVSGLARRLPGRLALRAERLGLTGLRGFDSVLRPGAWWRIPSLSVLTWATSAGAFALVLVASRVEAGWTAPLLLTSVGALGMALPTPAGIGGFEAVFTHFLDAELGVPVSQAAAVSLLAHAVAVVPALLLGLYYFLREGLDLRGLRRTAAGAPAQESVAGEERRP